MSEHEPPGIPQPSGPDGGGEPGPDGAPPFVEPPAGLHAEGAPGPGPEADAADLESEQQRRFGRVAEVVVSMAKKASDTQALKDSVDSAKSKIQDKHHAIKGRQRASNQSLARAARRRRADQQREQAEARAAIARMPEDERESADHLNEQGVVPGLHEGHEYQQKGLVGKAVAQAKYRGRQAYGDTKAKLTDPELFGVEKRSARMIKDGVANGPVRAAREVLRSKTESPLKIKKPPIDMPIGVMETSLDHLSDDEKDRLKNPLSADEYRDEIAYLDGEMGDIIELLDEIEEELETVTDPAQRAELQAELRAGQDELREFRARKYNTWYLHKRGSTEQERIKGLDHDQERADRNEKWNELGNKRKGAKEAVAESELELDELKAVKPDADLPEHHSSYDPRGTFDIDAPGNEHIPAAVRKYGGVQNRDQLQAAIKKVEAELARRLSKIEPVLAEKFETTEQKHAREVANAVARDNAEMGLKDQLRDLRTVDSYLFGKAEGAPVQQFDQSGNLVMTEKERILNDIYLTAQKERRLNGINDDGATPEADFLKSNVFENLSSVNGQWQEKKKELADFRSKNPGVDTSSLEAELQQIEERRTMLKEVAEVLQQTAQAQRKSEQYHKWLLLNEPEYGEYKPDPVNPHNTDGVNPEGIDYKRDKKRLDRANSRGHHDMTPGNNTEKLHNSRIDHIAGKVDEKTGQRTGGWLEAEEVRLADLRAKLEAEKAEAEPVQGRIDWYQEQIDSSQKQIAGWRKEVGERTAALKRRKAIQRKTEERYGKRRLIGHINGLPAPRRPVEGSSSRDQMRHRRARIRRDRGVDRLGYRAREIGRYAGRRRARANRSTTGSSS